MTTRTTTQRQRQSREASRTRARRRRSHWLTARLKIAGTISATLLVLGLGIASTTGALATLHTRAIARVDAATVRLGFAVNTVYLEGRKRTPASAVEEALAVRRGDPMLTLSLNATRERLEAIPTVKSAVVERALPDTLHVRLKEREPVAIWQYQHSLALLDDAGAVMTDLAVAEYANLPLLIGEGVPEHIQEALALVATSQRSSNHVAHITRVGNRRWDVTFAQGVTVRLPADSPLRAWEAFSTVDASSHLAQRAVKVIDLRDPGRLVIQRAVTPAEPSAAPAQET